MYQSKHTNVEMYKFHFQGNYFGAVKGWTESVKSSDSSEKNSNIFSIVDLHAITLPQKPGLLFLDLSILNLFCYT
jgi:hypothetical protein